VGSNEKTKAHFVGSVVYVAAEETFAAIARWLLIDGQQRLTTVTLLLAALRNRMPNPDSEIQQATDEGVLPTRSELEDNYLFNTHGKGDRRFKLHLRRTDQETLAALLEEKELPRDVSERIRENFEFFEEKLADADLDVVYRGIKKLVAVDVSLTRGQDDPQMIFESLNSTGLELTQADLIRNFVLMRLDEQLQAKLYENYWQPIEKAFGERYRSDFDKFVRDYLTLQLKPSKQFKADSIYQEFRTYFYGIGSGGSIDELLAKLKRFGGYYVAFSLGHEDNPKLKEAFGRLRLLVEVASPAVLRLYDCYNRVKTLSLSEFIEGVELLESYVFRRSVCAMQTRSLGQIFASLAYRIRDEAPLLSLKVALSRQGKKRRFPSDTEFREALETRDIYDMRNCHYLLDRLENQSKEKIDTSTFTIEHVMPQNDDLSAEWRAMLGKDWKSIQEVWLHRLGNITLTGYNSEYSDRSFSEKKTTSKGSNESPLRLTRFIRDQTSWTTVEIEKRGKDLASKAVGVWPPLVVDADSVRAAELEDLKNQAAQYSVDSLEFDDESKALFALLRAQIGSLGDDVIELCGARSVTYRVYDFFVEVIPRKRRLLLVLNVDYEECDAPTQRAQDATENAFIPNASESGGVLFKIKNETHIGPSSTPYSSGLREGFRVMRNGPY
jgi:uncharacterized protein with ParB-like and HNH nuclease domain/predicted transport protein